MMKRFQILLQIFAAFTASVGQAFTLDRERLYHAGHRELLMQNIEARTVPALAWKNAIFAAKTNFDLPAYRKGLYGAESVAGTNLYLTYQLLAGRTPWLMTIGLKKECLPKSYDSSFSVESGAFATWFQEHVSEIDAASCQIGGAWNLGTFYDVSESPGLNRCVSELHHFLNDQQIPIAFDLVNNDSWYIRDRSCISTIEGTADENLRALLDNRIGSPEASRLENWYGDNVEPGSFYAGNTIFLLSLLAESQQLHTSLIPRLDSLKAEIDTWYPRAEQVRELKLDRALDNPRIVSLFLTSAMIAIRNDNVKAWQADLRALLRALVKAFGESCHGRHGVAAEHQRTCLAESNRQTLRLVDFLSQPHSPPYAPK
jgi:hypothetical protein